MFNKASKPARPGSGPQAENGPRRLAAAPPVPSLLGPGLMFEGAISGDGELHIEGAAKAEIEVARLVIGEHAEVEGVIRGGSVEIRGRFRGNIEAQTVKLYETARVEGDIVHEKLSIEGGAVFEGRCQQAKRLTAPEAPPQLVGPQPPHLNGAGAHGDELPN